MTFKAEIVALWEDGTWTTETESIDMADDATHADAVSSAIEMLRGSAYYRKAVQLFPWCVPLEDGTEGQDRDSYSDTQNRDSYTAD